MARSDCGGGMDEDAVALTVGAESPGPLGVGDVGGDAVRPGPPPRAPGGPEPRCFGAPEAGKALSRSDSSCRNGTKPVGLVKVAEGRGLGSLRRSVRGPKAPWLWPGGAAARAGGAAGVPDAVEARVAGLRREIDAMSELGDFDSRCPGSCLHCADNPAVAGSPRQGGAPEEGQGKEASLVEDSCSEDA